MMIVQFRVSRRDTKAPIQDARVRMEHGEADSLTNSTGVAEIVTFWSGNLLYSVEAIGYDKISGTVQVPVSGSVTMNVELGVMAAPQIPPPSDEQVVGIIGAQCDIVVKYIFDQRMKSFRNRYTGYHYAWLPQTADIPDYAAKEAGCYDAPPPAPKTVDDVQKDVDILRGTLQGISSRVNDLLTGFEQIGKDILDLEARLKAWIEERILDLIWMALTREKKVG